MDDLGEFLTRMLEQDADRMRKAAHDWPPALDGLSDAHAQHIRRYQPAWTFVDLDSKRHTLVRCQEEMLSGIPRLVWFARQTMWEMALPYQWEKGFKEEWQPRAP